MESLTFINTAYKCPGNLQYVWLLIDKASVPVPARFHSPKHGNPYYSLLDAEMVSGKSHAWAPMMYPTNTNMSS